MSAVELVGMTQLLASLEEYRVRKTTEVKEAVHLAAIQAQNDAIDNCPVAPDERHGNVPGTLRDGNLLRELPELRTIFQWELYNAVPYAGFVILGTYKMAARDFFTPAFEVGKQALHDRLAVIAASR